MQDDQTINRFYSAMQAGSTAEEEMMSLFADDAVYSEPFSGRGAHHGKEAIRQVMRGGWERRSPETKITVDHFEKSGNDVRVEWTCYMEMIPGGKMSGEDRFTLQDGRIVRLETRLGGPK
jgi:ketosteroid isomerase-like protein